MLSPKFLKLSSKVFIAAVALIVLWRLYDGLFLAERHMDELFKETKTLCVGRFEITLPASADVSLTGTYNRVSASKAGIYLNFEDLVAYLQSRADEMKNIKMDVPKETLDFLNYARKKEGDVPVSISETQLINFSKFSDDKSILLSYHKNNIDNNIIVEKHKFFGKTDYSFTTLPGYGMEDFEPMVKLIIPTADKFHPYRDENDRRADEPAYCLGDGYFAASADPEIDERFSLYVTFPSLKGVSFDMRARMLHRPSREGSLFDMVQEQMGVLVSLLGRVTLAEKNRPEYAGLRGERAVLKARFDGQTSRKVLWRYEGELKSANKPKIDIEMMTGDVNSAEDEVADVSDAETIALFERLMESFKLRPGSL